MEYLPKHAWGSGSFSIEDHITPKPLVSLLQLLTGVLVTTCHYGSDSYEFAQNKSLKLSMVRNSWDYWRKQDIVSASISKMRGLLPDK